MKPMELIIQSRVIKVVRSCMTLGQLGLAISYVTIVGKRINRLFGPFHAYKYGKILQELYLDQERVIRVNYKTTNGGRA